MEGHETENRGGKTRLCTAVSYSGQPPMRQPFTRFSSLENERKRGAEGVDDQPSKKRRLPRGVQGMHAKDMSVVNLTNLNSHPVCA